MFIDAISGYDRPSRPTAAALDAPLEIHESLDSDYFFGAPDPRERAALQTAARAERGIEAGCIISLLGTVSGITGALAEVGVLTWIGAGLFGVGVAVAMVNCVRCLRSTDNWEQLRALRLG